MNVVVFFCDCRPAYDRAAGGEQGNRQGVGRGAIRGRGRARWGAVRRWAVRLTYGPFRLPGHAEKHKPPHPRLATPKYTKQHSQGQISGQAFSGA